MGRGALSQERISLNEKGEILYELKHSSDGATHVLFSPLDFLEKLASIIPPPKKHLVKYYGCLSSHSALRPLIVPMGVAVNKDTTVAEEEPLAADENQDEANPDAMKKEEAKKSNYIDWQTLLKKVFKIDISVCPKYEGRMRVIAVINERIV